MENIEKKPYERFSGQIKYIEKVKNDNDAWASERGERKRAYIVTFGCQQNEADGERMKGLSLAMGYDLTNEPAGASLILVNTCAIREHAEQKALSIIGQYKHLKQKNKEYHLDYNLVQYYNHIHNQTIVVTNDPTKS